MKSTKLLSRTKESKVKIRYICMTAYFLILAVTSCTEINLADQHTPTPFQALAQTPTNVSIILPPIVTESPNPDLVLTSTLPSTESQVVEITVYSENEECELPCYWGIVPGKTEWGNVRAFFLATGEIAGPYGKPESFEIWVSDSPNGLYPSGMAPVITVENDVITMISTNSSWISADFDLSLSGILEKVGEPDEIWLRVVNETSDNQPYYNIVLFYSSRGILFHWEGNVKNVGKSIELCPKDFYTRSDYPPGLLLWDPEKHLDFSNFEEKLVGSNSHFAFLEYGPISNHGFSVGDFYQTFLDSETSFCLQVNSTQ